MPPQGLFMVLVFGIQAALLGIIPLKKFLWLKQFSFWDCEIIKQFRFLVYIF